MCFLDYKINLGYFRVGFNTFIISLITHIKYTKKNLFFYYLLIISLKYIISYFENIKFLIVLLTNYLQYILEFNSIILNSLYE